MVNEAFFAQYNKHTFTLISYKTTSIEDVVRLSWLDRRMFFLGRLSNFPPVILYNCWKYLILKSLSVRKQRSRSFPGRPLLRNQHLQRESDLVGICRNAPYGNILPLFLPLLISLSLFITAPSFFRFVFSFIFSLVVCVIHLVLFFSFAQLLRILSTMMCTPTTCMGVIHQQDCVPSFYDSSLHWFILNNKKPADFGAGREKMFWRAERKKRSACHGASSADGHVRSSRPHRLLNE